MTTISHRDSSVNRAKLCKTYSKSVIVENICNNTTLYTVESHWLKHTTVEHSTAIFKPKAKSSFLLANPCIKYPLNNSRVDYNPSLEPSYRSSQCN